MTHDILARTFGDGDMEPGAVAARALEIFDREMPRMAAAFYLPGFDGRTAEYPRHRRARGRALAVRLKEGGYSVAAVEEPRRRSCFGVEVEGRPISCSNPRP